MPLYVGELEQLPAGVVVECVTASALNAAIRHGGVAQTNVERERLRVASGAPANAGTDLQHAQRGLANLYHLSTVIVNDFASIKAAVAANESVLIRGEYCSLPAPYRFQTACSFSHCILLTNSSISGNGFVIDPLDNRGPGRRPLGKNIPWAFIKAYCDSDQDNALLVPGPGVGPVAPPAPVVVPAPAPGPVTLTAAQSAAAHAAHVAHEAHVSALAAAAAHLATVAHAAHLAVLHALHVLHIKNKG